MILFNNEAKKGQSGGRMPIAQDLDTQAKNHLGVLSVFNPTAVKSSAGAYTGNSSAQSASKAQGLPSDIAYEAEHKSELGDAIKNTTPGTPEHEAALKTFHAATTKWESERKARTDGYNKASSILQKDGAGTYATDGQNALVRDLMTNDFKVISVEDMFRNQQSVGKPRYQMLTLGEASRRRFEDKHFSGHTEEGTFIDDLISSPDSASKFDTAFNKVFSGAGYNKNNKAQDNTNAITHAKNAFIQEGHADGKYMTGLAIQDAYMKSIEQGGVGRNTSFEEAIQPMILRSKKDIIDSKANALIKTIIGADTKSSFKTGKAPTTQTSHVLLDAYMGTGESTSQLEGAEFVGKDGTLSVLPSRTITDGAAWLDSGFKTELKPQERGDRQAGRSFLDNRAIRRVTTDANIGKATTLSGAVISPKALSKGTIAENADVKIVDMPVNNEGIPMPQLLNDSEIGDAIRMMQHESARIRQEDPGITSAEMEEVLMPILSEYLKENKINNKYLSQEFRMAPMLVVEGIFDASGNKKLQNDNFMNAGDDAAESALQESIGIREGWTRESVIRRGSVVIPLGNMKGILREQAVDKQFLTTIDSYNMNKAQGTGRAVTDGGWTMNFKDALGGVETPSSTRKEGGLITREEMGFLF